MTIKKSHYQYEYEETELGYEVNNLRKGTRYFVTETEEMGWKCNCPDIQINGAKECKHIKNVKRLFKKD